MPRFRNLSDAVRHNVEVFAPESVAPPGSTTGVLLGQGLPVDINSNSTPDNGFQWGFSTWGVDTITSVEFPEN